MAVSKAFIARVAAAHVTYREGNRVIQEEATKNILAWLETEHGLHPTYLAMRAEHISIMWNTLYEGSGPLRVEYRKSADEENYAKTIKVFEVPRSVVFPEAYTE